MTTPLFSISLMGRGTADVESLPSYLHRCAIGHGCDVGQLMKAVDRVIPSSQLCISDSKPRYIKPHELLRSGKLTDIFIDSFFKATGERLESSVLWILRTVLGVSTEETVKGFRWCPECLSECEGLGIPAYFKLIWHLSSVKACHIHRTPLVQACEFCGSDQTSYKKKDDIGTCQECEISLSKRKIPISENELTASWEDLGNDVIELLKDLAFTGVETLPEDGPYKSINDLLDYYWKIDREDVFYSALTRDEMIALSCREKKISLLTARRVAFRLGVPLYAFLAGEASQTPGVLDHGMFCTLPEGYLDAKHKARKDHMEILTKINNIVTTGEVPLTVKSVCKQVGISTGYLAYRYPVLYKDIVIKRKAYDEELRLKIIYRAQAAALDYFISEEYSTAPKSRNQAYKCLRRETGLPKWELVKAIEVAYGAIN